MRALFAGLISVFSCAMAGVEPMDKQAGELAEALSSDAHGALEQRIEECNAKRVIIEPEVLIATEAEEKHVLLAIGYHSIRSHNECTEAAALDFLQAAALTQYAQAQGFSGIPGQETEDVSSLVTGNWWLELRAKAQYLDNVPAEARQTLDALEHFQRPFHPIKTWDAYVEVLDAK
ncbi:MAG: hypothetical protein LAT50_12900 [Ectothiorhodospiraceae bacterium]|nr:hypothetical protein [Ectothiorhodospiraceae bacterium]